jgi:ABC-type antimicrobial peptide transport system permease subunit
MGKMRILVVEDEPVVAMDIQYRLRKLGYADPARPTMITIYPIDFESKTQVKRILDTYNDLQRQAGDDDKVIAYTDMVDTLMSSVTDIINAISYVLIAFVAISLVVSSIMIGVITYISVLERNKEIGILRAIGASKRNISQVFNAETFIIGALAGVFGIVFTWLRLIPANQLIHPLTGQTGINAVLPPSAAGILILLSIVLTLIGGIIPSRKAARSDPVTALRSE